ncbi:MAG: conjugal transfer protein TraX [Clostridium sp.]|nr:conjugal transfer protein TraX [Clostridium sp.]
MTTTASPTTSTGSAFGAPAKKGITGSTIKLIAIIAMLIDHIAAVILERMLMRAGYLLATTNTNLLSEWIAEHRLLYFSYMIMRLIGRFGFPIFCFLLVEGFLHTHNRKKYALRLCLFALVSEIPFDFAFRGEWFYTGYQNVFFTLFLGLLAMCAFSWIKEHVKGGVPGVLCLAAGILLTGCYGGYSAYYTTTIAYALLDPFIPASLGNAAFFIIPAVLTAVIIAFLLLWLSHKHGAVYAQAVGADLGALCIAAFAADLLMTDYSGMGVITIALMYAFRKHPVKSMLAGCICLTLMDISEASAFLMLIPISRYNGKRGLSLKYVFYAFYPVHLALLYLICYAMGLS